MSSALNPTRRTLRRVITTAIAAAVTAATTILTAGTAHADLPNPGQGYGSYEMKFNINIPYTPSEAMDQLNTTSTATSPFKDVEAA